MGEQGLVLQRQAIDSYMLHCQQSSDADVRENLHQSNSMCSQLGASQPRVFKGHIQYLRMIAL